MKLISHQCSLLSALLKTVLLTDIVPAFVSMCVCPFPLTRHGCIISKYHGALLLTWINFIPTVVKSSDPLWSVRWNNRWSLLVMSYYTGHVITHSIMMLVRFGDLSQSDCSKWVMWQVKDPQPRPGWDGCLTWEKVAFIKCVKKLNNTTGYLVTF